MIEVADLMAKFDLIGIPHEEAQMRDGSKIFLYKDEVNYYLMIPDNVTKIQVSEFPFKDITRSEIDETVIVCGGKNLEAVEGLFGNVQIHAIDFTCFQTSNVTSMANMFTGFSTDGFLDLATLDTSHVKSMQGMFSFLRAEKLFLFQLHANSVVDMSHMFKYAQIDELDLVDFDTSRVKDMSYMFSGAEINELNLTGFNTSQVVNMKSMFKGADLSDEGIDFSSFDTRQVEDMSYMFGETWINALHLSSFDTSNVQNMEGMFEECTANVVDISSFDIPEKCAGMFREFCPVVLTMPSNFENAAFTFFVDHLESPEDIVELEKEGIRELIDQLDKTHLEEDSDKLYQKTNVRIRFKQGK